MENCITVGEMIAETKELNRGAYSDSQLMKWLSDVDARLYQEVICTHVGIISAWSPYEHMEDPLLIPAAWREVYRHWLDAKIYLAGGETNRYNNAAALYNTALSNYTNWYNRTHRPLHQANITF